MIRTERIDCAGLLRDSRRMATVARWILDGAVCVYPTDTIYGIGGRCDSEAVRERIHSIKGRVADNPMILLASDIEQLRRAGAGLDGEAMALARQFWPGYLTLVVARRGGGTVAVRQCAHPFILALGAHIEQPLFSTSANPSGAAYEGEPDAVWKLFNGKVDFMIDDGRLAPSKPSTVLRAIDGEAVRLLREGAVSADAIQGVLARQR